MVMNRREFIASSVAGAALLQQGLTAFGDPVENLPVTIDATKCSGPVSPLVFGGYMEPATTRVWAEMLGDRKFARTIVSSPPMPSNPFFRRFMGEPWLPIGPEDTVEMDTVQPWVGAHSPRIKLTGSAERGIKQSGLRLGSGRSYVGRIYLAGNSGARIEVRLVWGTGASDSQVISIPTLSSEYQKFPLKFMPSANADNARIEIVGTGTGAFHIGTVSLMPADNVQGFHAGMVQLYKEAGFKMAKWPGGNFVSAYDWYEGLGDPDKRPPRPQPMWHNMVESNDVGIHEFIAFCRLVGAEPYVAVNSGYGEARVAAEEVEYCNGSTSTRLGKMRAENGNPEPFNIRLWCIGNEMYGFWQYGHMSLDQYWVKHNYFVEAMKKVDPKIKVTVAGASVCEESWTAAENKQFAPDIWQPPVLEKMPFQFGGTRDWDGWLLEKCADNIDFLSEHTYAYPDLAFDAQKQEFVDVKDPLPLRTRRLANRIGEAFEAWQRYVEKMPTLKEKNIKFIFDEWGTRYRSAKGGSGFQRPVGMVTPLSYALFLHELFRHSDMVEASCPTGGLFTVLVDDTGHAAGYSAEGLVLKIMGKHFPGAFPVEVNGTSPQHKVSGTPFVDSCEEPTGSPTYPLDIVAALSGDRKTFILSVINPTEADHEFSPHIAGVKLRGPGKLWQIAAPAINSANEPGKPPVVQILEHPQDEMADKVHVPPISINVYEFEIADV